MFSEEYYYIVESKAKIHAGKIKNQGLEHVENEKIMSSHADFTLNSNSLCRFASFLHLCATSHLTGHGLRRGFTLQVLCCSHQEKN